MLVVLLTLFDVLVKHVAKIVPAGLRDQDGISEVALYLRDCDVASLRILFAGEVEVFVLDAHVAVVRCTGGLLDLSIIVLLDEFLEMVIELVHSVGWDEDLEARVASCEGLGYLQEATPSVFLK